MVAALVQGDSVQLDGYGLPRLGHPDTVDATQTLFDVGSVTKLLTAIAVLQQVEQGRLDLEADVNTYLTAFQVPTAYGSPLTLRHLLTHTAGFDDKNIGYVARTEAESETLEAYLAHELPPRVMPPGQILSYSNHGYGLAGYLVEVVTGQPFADYLAAHILEPLGMTRSTLVAPVPEAFAAARATGYVYNFRTGQFEAAPEAYRKLPPAGGFSTTGADMARLMQALLHGGGPILPPASTARLFEQQFTHDPLLPGYTFALWERPVDTLQTFEIRGAFPGFSAGMVLVPSRQAGLFVATNRTDFGEFERLRAGLLESLGATEPAPAPLLADPAFTEEAARYAGAYHLTRYGRTSPERIVLFDGAMRIIPTGAGTLELRSRRGPLVDELTPVPGRPHVFLGQAPGDYTVFLTDESGDITHFASTLGNGFPAAFERLAWTDDPAYQVPIMIGMLVAFAAAFLLYPLLLGGFALVRRLRQPPPSARPKATVLAWLLVGFGLTAAVFLAGIGETLGNTGYRQHLLFGWTPLLEGLRALGWASVVLGLGTAGATLRAWRHGRGSLLTRGLGAAMTATLVGYLAFLAHWNLLG